MNNLKGISKKLMKKVINANLLVSEAKKITVVTNAFFQAVQLLKTFSVNVRQNISQAFELSTTF